MKVILLAGGLGTRISEESASRPKPMIEIGGKPILVHLMESYAEHGFNEFVIACGYKGEMIKAYFQSLRAAADDCTIELATGRRTVLSSKCPDWNVTMIDTGLSTMTGGRIKRLREYTDGQTFMVTYGDGLSDIDLPELVRFHKSHNRLATVTAVRPPARFGGLNIEAGEVKEFTEKPQASAGWINGGFFVFEPAVFDYIAGDNMPLELEPLEHLARDGELMAYEHHGFWQPMDTLREKQLLESLWQSGKAPWKPSDTVDEAEIRGRLAA